MDQITKPYLNNFREKFGKTLDEFGEQEDVTIEMGNISYSNNIFNVRLKVTIAGDAEEAARLQFIDVLESNPYLFSDKDHTLVPEDYGVEFTCFSNHYKLVGLKPRSTKYPLVVEKDGKDGKRFKLPLGAYTTNRPAD